MQLIIFSFCFYNFNTNKSLLTGFLKRYPKNSDNWKTAVFILNLISAILPHRCPKDANGMANNVDPDQSDLGLHCLPRHVSPKIKDHYANNITYRPQLDHQQF